MRLSSRIGREPGEGWASADAVANDVVDLFPSELVCAERHDAEEMLYDDSKAMRRFAGIELGDGRIPDEFTILSFRLLSEPYRIDNYARLSAVPSLQRSWS